MTLLPDPDEITATKTIYDVSKWEVFWRNLIAGAGRALGGIVLQAIFLLIVVNLFMSQVWPILQPIMESLQTTSQTLQDIQKQSQEEFDIFKFGR
jgi:hypothetical protein